MTETRENIKILNLRGAGMFSNVNEFLDNVIKAKLNDYVFAVDWSKSPYRDPSINIDNPWEYYFYSPYGVDRNDATEPLQSIIGTEHEVVAPHVEIDVPLKIDDTADDPYTTSLLLPPKDRDEGYEAIDNRLHIKEKIQQEVDSFIKENFDGSVIGVHLRGPHRDDGGSGYYRQLYPTDQSVPFELAFSFVDKRLSRMPDSSLYIASDSKFVINRFRERYNDRNVITYEANRVDSGEMHQSYTTIGSIKPRVGDILRGNYQMRDLIDGAKRTIDLLRSESMSDYELGKDVLVEASLLSRTDHLIHGCSNVTNFVLCNNPDLNSDFIFKEDLEDIYDDFYDWEVGSNLQVEQRKLQRHQT